MIVYRVAPIDDWFGWRKFEEALDDDGYEYGITLSEINGFFARAKYIARTFLLWDGDIREGPYWVPVPNTPLIYDPVFMVAWKQDNNGTTFVASPFSLPQLDGECEEAMAA